MSFEYKTYTKSQLLLLIKSEWFSSSAVIPISTVRALSHSQNPNAAEEDVLLIICSDGVKMVGYLGLLPTAMSENKAAWFSCLWTDETYRGKGIAKELIATALLLYKQKILVTEFTPIAKSLYDKTGAFATLAKYEGFRCFYRLNSHIILPKKKQIFTYIQPLLKWADSCYNALLPASGVPSGWELSACTEEVLRFVNCFQQNDMEAHIADKLKWINESPWLYESPPNPESQRYHFSSAVRQFRSLLYVKRESGKLTAVVLLHLRDGVLKVPYFFMHEMAADIVPLLIAVLHSYRLSHLDVYHPLLKKEIVKNRKKFIYLHPIHREVIITTRLLEKVKDVQQLQDGVGDSSFT